MAFFLLWTARRYISGWPVRALTLRSDPDMDIINPTFTLALMIFGFGGTVSWYIAAGGQWWAIVLTTSLFFLLMFVITRIVAESGLLFVQSGVLGFDLIKGWFPAAWITPSTMVALVSHKSVLCDYREALMPFLMNGLRSADTARLRLKQVMAVFALTVVIAFFVSAYGRIATSYKYGALNMDTHAHVRAPSWSLESAANIQKNPPEYQFLTVGEKKIAPLNLTHAASGGAFTAFLLFMRAKFLWWPLHPFGFILCSSWAISMIWFSMFLGWLCKFFIMTFGGAPVYRKVMPVFLGLILGECLISAFWMVIAFITQKPVIQIMIS
jgi:hypothetical protein